MNVKKLNETMDEFLCEAKKRDNKQAADDWWEVYWEIDHNLPLIVGAGESRIMNHLLKKDYELSQEEWKRYDKIMANFKKIRDLVKENRELSRNYY